MEILQDFLCPTPRDCAYLLSMGEPARPLIYTLLLLSVASMGGSILFIRSSALEPVDLAFYRLAGSGLILLPLCARMRRREKVVPAWRSIFVGGIVPGFFLAAHFWSWVIGARLAPAANATLAVNMTPLVLPFLLWVVLREKVSAKECAATLLGLAGIAWIAKSDLSADPQYFKGDLICLGSMVSLAIYVTLGRKNTQRYSNPWVYTVPLFLCAALWLALGGICAGTPLSWPATSEWKWIGCLVLFPTILGHGLTIYCLKWVRGQVVAICNLAQFLFAAFFAWLAWAEVPPGSFWVASALVAGAAVVAIRSSRPGRRKQELSQGRA